MKHYPHPLLTLLVLALPGTPGLALEPATPALTESAWFEEQDGLVVAEAEQFFRQTDTSVRAWYLVNRRNTPEIAPDGDPNHAEGASGGAYLEILPDTRRSHDDKLIAGENFSNAPGPMATLHYKVYIHNPGRYYVWARIYSTNTEDNGLHVGIDGEWPESGQRMQWTAKDQWYWDSKQRTREVHTGEPYKLYLDIDEPGFHTIMFSMREDGTEFDKWLMTRDRDFERPEEAGPTALYNAGELLTSGAGESGPDGSAEVAIHGELKQWHKLTLDLAGPWASEAGGELNPFTDCRMTVTFGHESGFPVYQVPGYFAADGQAAESSATSGHTWRAHLSPDKAGTWEYTIHFAAGEMAAVVPAAGEALAPYDGLKGSFVVKNSDKSAPDLRARGRLAYSGERYLRFLGDGSYFLKAGPDAPETLLAYTGFDNTVETIGKGPLKTWEPHLRDWREGDPSWQAGRGKALVGAVNYLAGKGMNVMSFLTYNAGGDGDNVWPYVTRNGKFNFDVSKLDQWEVLFAYAQSRGIYLHFKLQENESDDNRQGAARRDTIIPESMDGGLLGMERKLYLREMVARFGHHLALNWNLGEENTQSYQEQRDMADYLSRLDPYRHHIVIHTFPGHQDRVYPQLLGADSAISGPSLQNDWEVVHQRTLKWLDASALAGRQWVCANDEQNPAGLGVPPDPGYEDFDGTATEKDRSYDLHDIRKYTLWGNLMAGGAGVEYYFGYRLPQNDLLCEDFRSRDRSWDYCRIALEFFADQKIPFWRMENADALVENADRDNSRYCLARPGEIYLVYLPEGGSCDLDLSAAEGSYELLWFNPRKGGDLEFGGTRRLPGGQRAGLGEPPSDPDQDWLAVIRRQ